MQRFDHKINEALAIHAEMVEYGGRALSNLKVLRRKAHRFAAILIDIMEHDMEEFAPFTATSKQNVDEWLDDRFLIMEQCFGEDRRVIIQLVRDGVSEEEFVSNGCLAIVRRRDAQSKSRSDLDVEASPTPSMTLEEERDFYKHKSAALAEQLRTLKADHRILLAADQAKDRILHVQGRKIAQLERIVGQMKEAVTV